MKWAQTEIQEAQSDLQETLFFLAFLFVCFYCEH